MKKSSENFIPFNDADEDNYTIKQLFQLDKDEAIYGLGIQQEGKMVQRNLKLNMIQGNTDDYIPFFNPLKGMVYSGTIIHPQFLKTDLTVLF